MDRANEINLKGALSLQNVHFSSTYLGELYLLAHNEPL